MELKVVEDNLNNEIYSMNRKFGALSSSQDPEKLALRVKGILVGLVPLFIMFSQSKDWGITEGEVMELVEKLTLILSATMVVWGQVRAWIKKPE